MKKERRIIDRIYIFVVGICISVIAFSILFLLFWGLLNSFKSRSEFLFDKFGLPSSFNFENYLKAISKMELERLQPSGVRLKFNFWGYVQNSLLYAVGCTLINVYLTSMMAYLCARYKKFFMARFIVNLVIVTMLIPLVGTMPATVKVLSQLNLFDSLEGVYFMSFNFLGMNFLIFYGIYSALPGEYAEAAFIDGASHWYVMTRIMMPLVRTTTSVLLVIVFVRYWNDYQTPLVYWYSHPTVAVGLQIYVSDPLNSAFGEKMAADILVALPMIAVFLCFKNKMLGSMTVGGLKG